ncbi:hypothetical protein FRB99_007075, partial [Tulasnella sp. 403]
MPSSISIYITFPTAFVLLLAIIYTTTLSAAKQPTLRYLRVLLAIPCCILWGHAAIPPNFRWMNEVTTFSTIFAKAAYLFMRTLDVGVVGFWDEPKDYPRWRLPRPNEKDGKEGDKEVNYVILPLPTTFKTRLAYALDLACTVRGTSFFHNHTWTSPKPLPGLNPTTSYTSFVLGRLKTIATDIVIADIGLNIFQTKQWDTIHPYPLTSLPIIQQIYYTLGQGALVVGGVCITYNIFSLLFVPLLRMNPEGWPDAMRNPLASTSIADFWSTRWHLTFKHVYKRLSLPVVYLFQPYLSRRAVQWLQVCVVFGISTLLHMLLYYNMPLATEDQFYAFFEWSTIKFFASQPLGLWIEA